LFHLLKHTIIEYLKSKDIDAKFNSFDVLVVLHNWEKWISIKGITTRLIDCDVVLDPSSPDFLQELYTFCSSQNMIEQTILIHIRKKIKKTDFIYNYGDYMIFTSNNYYFFGVIGITKAKIIESLYSSGKEKYKLLDLNSPTFLEDLDKWLDTIK